MSEAHWQMLKEVAFEIKRLQTRYQAEFEQADKEANHEVDQRAEPGR